MFQTHCARHRTPLLEACGICFIEGPLEITNTPRDKSLQLASCWNCGSSPLLYEPEPATSPTVVEILDLESAILKAVLGNRLILAGPDGFAPKRSPRALSIPDALSDDLFRRAASRQANGSDVLLLALFY